MRAHLILLTCILLAVTACGQNINITAVHRGPEPKLYVQTLALWEVLDSTSYPDSLFKELRVTSRAIGAGWSMVDYFEYNYVGDIDRDEFEVFKIVFVGEKEQQTIIGCFGHKSDIKFEIRPFEGKTGVMNSMELYRKGVELEKKGKKKQANKLYKQAVACGNSLAAGRLAYNYGRGIGCVKNKKKSSHYATIAEYALGGSPYTKRNER